MFQAAPGLPTVDGIKVYMVALTKITVLLACVIAGVLTFGIVGSMTCKQQHPATHTSLGFFTHATDVGQPALTGSTMYDSVHQTYTLHASGTNMWGTHDEFHAVWCRLQGDFVLRTHARFTSDGEPHRKMGWIVRTLLDDNSTYADVVVSGNGMAWHHFNTAPPQAVRQR